MGDFVTNPSSTLFDDKVASRSLPINADVTRYMRAVDVNALKGAANDLRTEVMALSGALGAFGSATSIDVNQLYNRCRYQIAGSESYVNDGETLTFLNDPYLFAPDVQFAGISSTKYPPSGGLHANLEARYYVVTDTEYLQQTLPVPTNGRVTFNIGRPAGVAIVKLFDTAAGHVKAYNAENTGRIRSYDFAITDPAYNQFRNRCYLYDQAVFLLALLCSDEGEIADRVAKALATSKNPDGSWRFSIDLVSGTGDDMVRNGAVAWCLYALCRYKHSRGANADASIATAITAGANYLQTQVSVAGFQAGSITGGRGRYVAEVFDGGYVVPWASTEHNLGAWAALRWAHFITGTASYKTTADNIAANLLKNHYNHVGRYFYQGIADPSTIDTATALDCMTWATYFLVETKRFAEARVGLKRALEKYENTVGGVRGFRPYIPADGYAGSVPTVWVEGTLGAAVAFYKVGDRSRWSTYLTETNKLRLPDGMLPYANVPDPLYEITSYPATIGVCWDLLARLDPDGVWTLPPV